MPSPRTQESKITPHGESTFEHVVRRLGLSPSDYASSAALKEWVRGQKEEPVADWLLLSPVTPFSISFLDLETATRLREWLLFEGVRAKGERLGRHSNASIAGNLLALRLR